ncbi:hypothetical protein B0H16DRAFT_1463251 [Mycena metata]|uniref:Uncharacterized protein n=1 Tax=Mycena metata TaxID=1033252 RepID=A0AAD7IJ55_9AGAR|nr:hypothetical protein B0H16DRAFT_1463251 [Mycena metata]
MSNPQANTFTSYAYTTDSSFPAPTNINSDGTPLLPAQSLYREPATTQELHEGVQPNTPLSTHSPYFIHHLDRDISLATAEELRSSGSRAYNGLLRDYCELMRVYTELQYVFWFGIQNPLKSVRAVYMVLSETVHNGFLLATSAATGHSPFAGPAWEGHPYNIN